MARRYFLAFTMMFLAASYCMAAIYGPGKYSGVVIFDRWGGCTLYDGVFLSYISESAKEQLREQVGKNVQVDAAEIAEGMAEGPILIKKLKLLGPTPENPLWDAPKGLHLSILPAFDIAQSPSFIIRADNAGEQPIKMSFRSLVRTLLAKKEAINGSFEASDGPSYAVAIRESFWTSDGPVVEADGIPAARTWNMVVTKPATPSNVTILQPGEKFEISLTFTLPAGEYEFFAGYGQTMNAARCAVSNLVGFDVDKDGHAKLVKDRMPDGSPTTRK